MSLSLSGGLWSDRPSIYFRSRGDDITHHGTGEHVGSFAFVGSNSTTAVSKHPQALALLQTFDT